MVYVADIVFNVNLQVHENSVLITDCAYRAP